VGEGRREGGGREGGKEGGRGKGGRVEAREGGSKGGRKKVGGRYCRREFQVAVFTLPSSQVHVYSMKWAYAYAYLNDGL